MSLAHPVRLIALAMLVAAAAPAQSPNIRDSAGIRVVESVAPASSAWRLDTVPLLVVGASTGAPEGKLSGVRSATRLVDGSIVVEDTRFSSARLFDHLGHLVGLIPPSGNTSGYTGDGDILRMPGDSVLVWDLRKHQLSVFGTDGRMARTLMVERPPPVPGLLVGLHALGVLWDGALLGWSAAWGYRPEIATLSESLTVWHAMPSGTIAPIATLFSAESYSYNDSAPGGQSWFGLRPFTVRGSVAAGLRSVWYTDGRSYEIHEFGLDGRLTRVGRIRRDLRPVTPDEIAAFRAVKLDHAGHLRAADSVIKAFVSATKEELDWLNYPSEHAAFSALMVARDGSVWARQDGDTSGVQHWDVFDSAAQWLGTIETPAGVVVLEIGADYVLGSSRDLTDGVEHVAVYRLVR